MNPQIAYLLNVSIQLIQQEKLDEAERALNHLIQLQPKNADALCFLSVIFAKRLNFSQAYEFINRSIEFNQKNSSAYMIKGNILRELGRFDDAFAAYKKAIHIDPKNHEAFNNLGNLLQELDKHSEAITNYETAIRLLPNYPQAYSNKGNALEKMGRYDESLAMYEKSIQINSNYVDAWLNRGFVLNKLKRLYEALESCDQAININPLFTSAWTNKGVILSNNRFYEESIKYFDKALSLDSKSKTALACKGSALAELKRYEDALSYLDKAYLIDDELPLLLGDIINLKLQIASWKSLDDQIENLLDKLDGGLNVIAPFKFCSVVDSPARALHIAQNWINTQYPEKFFLPKVKSKSKSKVRIGYFSADFKDQHPVSLLTAEVYELHNRDEFEIFAFSLKGVEEGDSLRTRLNQAFDQFIDLEDKTEIEVAKIARDLEIDIAVDLGGHTEFAPTGVMSYRVAPIQVNYLGYPGTMGAQYMDYIIADPILIPERSRQFYTEKVAYLPHTYMVDDSKRIPSNRIFTKKLCELPEDKFIFCCFNNSYKFNKIFLNIWVKILNAVPNSILWIPENNVSFRENISREFFEAGIENERIIFANRVERNSDHLARLSLADLFLDTHPFNAHSTAVDALKAGVPLLTYIGEAFPSRVAGSLLSAIGLPELICHSLEGYVRMAIELASNPEKLKLLKNKLQENKQTKPLFDTRNYVKNLELAYMQMYVKNKNGLPPEHIFVNENLGGRCKMHFL